MNRKAEVNKTDSKEFPTWWERHFSWAGWFAPKILLSMLLVWILINIAPWQVISKWELYQHYTDFVASLIPSIDLLPDAARFGGVEYSRAQLAATHTIGFIFLILIILTTKTIPLKKNLNSKNHLAHIYLIVILFLFGAFLVWLLLYWKGTFLKGLRSGWHDSEMRMTAFYLFWWFIIATSFAISLTFLKAYIKKFINK